MWSWTVVRASGRCGRAAFDIATAASLRRQPVCGTTDRLRLFMIHKLSLSRGDHHAARSDYLLPAEPSDVQSEPSRLRAILRHS